MLHLVLLWYSLKHWYTVAHSSVHFTCTFFHVKPALEFTLEELIGQYLLKLHLVEYCLYMTIGLQWDN